MVQGRIEFNQQDNRDSGVLSANIPGSRVSVETGKLAGMQQAQSCGTVSKPSTSASNRLGPSRGEGGKLNDWMLASGN
jgi:hypothetical protein